MKETIANVVTFADIALIGVFVLLYPKIMRRGLLFGVYVGEERSGSDAARAITRDWYRGMAVSIVGSLLLAFALVATGAHPLASVAPSLVLVAAFFAFYLRAYRKARGLAAPEAVPMAAAPLAVSPAPSLAFPWSVLAIGILCGVYVIGYTLANYDALPDPMPTHFGPSGAPDAWSKKGFASVMIMPIMGLLVGIVLGGAALLTARAKRAVRLDDGGRSLDAQNRFRSAMTKFLSTIALLTIAMLTTVSVSAVDVALGRRAGIPGWAMVLALALAVYAIGGSVWLAIRYGQGGARLEGGAAGAALTDGLADNRLWRLGLFYVNPDDPSWLVEHRFGFGYTLNFGNPKAVVALVVLLGSVLGLTAWAMVAL
jgi:uncharacterized membrane protein